MCLSSTFFDLPKQTFSEQLLVQEQPLLRVTSTTSTTSKPEIDVPLAGARKNKAQKKLLKSFYK